MRCAQLRLLQGRCLARRLRPVLVPVAGHGDDRAVGVLAGGADAVRGGETVTFTVPALTAAGAAAVTRVAGLTVNPVAGRVPKCTAVAPVNRLPVMVTLVPPACGPLAGLMAVTVGAVGGAPVGTTAVATATAPPSTGMAVLTMLVAVRFSRPASP